MDFTMDGSNESYAGPGYHAQCPACHNTNAINFSGVPQRYWGNMPYQAELDAMGLYHRHPPESNAQPPASILPPFQMPYNPPSHSASLAPQSHNTLRDNLRASSDTHVRPDFSRNYPAMPPQNEPSRAGDPFGGAFSNQLDGHGVPSQLQLASNGGEGRAGIWSTPFPHLAAGLSGHPSGTFDYAQPRRNPTATQMPTNGAEPNTRPALTSGPTTGDSWRDNSRLTRLLRLGSPHDGSDASAAERRLHNDWGSDDDDSDLSNDAEAAFRRDAVREAMYHELEDERHIAAMRGVLAGGKRLPSKEAIASLEIVKVEDLSENDKSCIICYNDFGVSNPEGILEKAIRLPKCKHIFGDKCIKKWFEDSDSCPYCRDKLPSELAVKKGNVEQTMRLVQRERMRLAQLSQRVAARQALAPHGGSYPEDHSSGRNPAAPAMSQDDYEFIMNRQADSWGSASPNRYSTAESPERRRQARGRMGLGRPGHLYGRPTSVGSARSLSQSYNHYQMPAHQRAYGLSNTQGPSTTTPPTRRPITVNLPRPTITNQELLSPESPSPPSTASSEEASPPVAVGSGLTGQRVNFGSSYDYTRSDWRPAARQAHQGAANQLLNNYMGANMALPTPSTTAGGRANSNGDGSMESATNGRPRWSS